MRKKLLLYDNKINLNKYPKQVVVDENKTNIKNKINGLYILNHTVFMHKTNIKMYNFFLPESNIYIEI